MATDIRLKEALPEITEALVATYTECGRTSHLGDRPRLHSGVSDPAHQGSSLVGQPGRTLQIAGLGGHASHLGDRPRLHSGVGDTARQDPSTVKLADPGGHASKLGDHPRLHSGVSYIAHQDPSTAAQSGRTL